MHNVDQKWLLLLAPDGKKFLVNTTQKKLSTHLGELDLENIKGTKIKSNKGFEFDVLRPSFVDFLYHLKRGPAVILPKDAAQILLNGGIGPGAKIIEIGTGSGWLSSVLAYFIGPKGKIISYEKEKRFAELAKKNFELLGLKNIDLKLEDARHANFSKYKNSIDAFIVDLAKPEDMLNSAAVALKQGGYFIAYCPQITQVLHLAKKLQDGFILEKVCEIFERNWIIKDKIARPQHDALSHTAFLCFARKK